MARASGARQLCTSARVGLPSGSGLGSPGRALDTSSKRVCVKYKGIEVEVSEVQIDEVADCVRQCLAAEHHADGRTHLLLQQGNV